MAPKKVDKPTDVIEFFPNRDDILSVDIKARIIEDSIKPNAKPQ
jgi:hypothetical protein